MKTIDLGGYERRKLVDTGLKTWADTTDEATEQGMQPIYLLPDGRFIVVKDDGGTPIIRETYKEIDAYFDGVRKRAAERAKRAAEGKKVFYEGTVLDSDINRASTAKTFAVTIRGYAADGKRILVNGLTDSRIDNYTNIYRRFTPEDHTRFAELQHAARVADAKLKQFLKDRKVGQGRDIAQAVDRGETVPEPLTGEAPEEGEFS